MRATKTKELLQNLEELRKRKDALISSLETGIDALAMETEQNQRAIELHEAALAVLRKEREVLLRRATRYISGTEQIIEGKAPRVEGKRIRTDIRFKPLDTTELRPTISHRFQSGELIIGHLQAPAAKELNGSVWSRTTAELVDHLYLTDSGEGFYSASYSRGVKLNPLAIFLDKARGRLLSG